MAQVKEVKKKVRKKFVGVDLWRGEFGPISVRAIYDVYSTKFNVEQYNMKKYSFQDCINALRKLEDPEYVKPQDQVAE